MYLFPAAEVRAESLRLTEAKEENERNAMTPAVLWMLGCKYPTSPLLLPHRRNSLEGFDLLQFTLNKLTQDLGLNKCLA